MSNFFIKWKGIESGPFSGEEIRGMFETGKIGLLHEIRSEGENEWFLLKDFDFSAQAAGGDGVKKGAADDLLFAAYFLCGASFLHPLIYLGVRRPLRLRLQAAFGGVGAGHACGVVRLVPGGNRVFQDGLSRSGRFLIFGAAQKKLQKNARLRTISQNEKNSFRRKQDKARGAADSRQARARGAGGRNGCRNMRRFPRARFGF